MEKTPAELLECAANLLEADKGAHWTKHVLARPDKRSRAEVDPKDCEAGAWCAVGALRYCSNSNGLHDTDEISNAITAVENLLPTSLIGWNDNPSRRYHQVVAKFRKAAAFLRSKEQATT